MAAPEDIWVGRGEQPGIEEEPRYQGVFVLRAAVSEMLLYRAEGGALPLLEIPEAHNRYKTDDHDKSQDDKEIPGLIYKHDSAQQTA